LEALKSEGKPLTKELTEVSQEWDRRQYDHSPEGVKEYNESMRKGYFEVVAFMAPKNMHNQKMYPYRFDVWDVLSMMLLGIALFKLNILSAQKSYTFYGMMALLGYLMGLSVNYYETTMIINSNFSTLATAKSNITYDLGRVPLSLGHVGLIMIFCKLPLLSWFKSAMAAVGKMALTNYVMHSVLAMFLFTGAGFGLFGTFSRHELMYIVFAIWI